MSEPSSPLQGWLFKLGEHSFSAWKRRYFRILGSALFYYEKNEDSHPCGKIELRDILDTVIDNNNPKAPKEPSDCCFNIITKKRTYVLLAEASCERNTWLETLPVICEQNRIIQANAESFRAMPLILPELLSSMRQRTMTTLSQQSTSGIYVLNDEGTRLTQSSTNVIPTGIGVELESEDDSRTLLTESDEIKPDHDDVSIEPRTRSAVLSSTSRVRSATIKVHYADASVVTVPVSPKSTLRQVVDQLSTEAGAKEDVNSAFWEVTAAGVIKKLILDLEVSSVQGSRLRHVYSCGGS